MDLIAEARVPFPRAVVFACYRDKMADLLPYLESVRKIDVTSRDEQEGTRTVKLVNVWHGGGDIPAAARAFVSEAMMSWTDTATWTEADYVCHWVIKTHAFTEAVSCEGWNTFHEDGPDATRITMKGSIEIDTKKVKGVPGFLAGKVAKTVEEMLKTKIQPNFVEVTKAITQHLEKTK